MKDEILNDSLSVTVFETPAAVAEAAAEAIAEVIRFKESTGARTSLMLAGGSTPRATYERLAGKDVPWHKVDFFFGDERAVPPDDKDSNYRMAREVLFDPIGVRSAQIMRMLGDAPDLEKAAREYEARLPEKISVLLLGMGEDGHTASLFPGSPALSERSRKVVRIVGPKPPPVRLTITPPVIEQAELCLVLVTGAAKREALTRVAGKSGNLSETPIMCAKNGLFLVDRAADPRGETSSKRGT